VRIRVVTVVAVAVALMGCSTGEPPEEDRLEEAIRALAEAGTPNRIPEAAHVDEVVCEQISATPTYDCSVHFGEGTPVAIFPFCAELRDGTVYINSVREGCGPSSQGYSFRRATPDDFG
jgi:hypothetical protein